MGFFCFFGKCKSSVWPHMINDVIDGKESILLIESGSLIFRRQHEEEIFICIYDVFITCY